MGNDTTEDTLNKVSATHSFNFLKKIVALCQRC